MAVKEFNMNKIKRTFWPFTLKDKKDENGNVVEKGKKIIVRMPQKGVFEAIKDVEANGTGEDADTSTIYNLVAAVLNNNMGNVKVSAEEVESYDIEECTAILNAYMEFVDELKAKQGVTKSCMLVLTERKTRDEIIFKLKDQKAESVVDALDRLERKWGDMFSKVFRSITVDNGVEFSDCKGMERSALTPGEKRTYLFYCHPYSSYERGTNENTNKLIRRHIPKGEDFDEKQDRDIEFIENWINTYPRGIFGFRTSEELFKEELEKITA